jgi:hypothetical protein
MTKNRHKWAKTAEKKCKYSVIQKLYSFDFSCLYGYVPDKGTKHFWIEGMIVIFNPAFAKTFYNLLIIWIMCKNNWRKIHNCFYKYLIINWLQNKLSLIFEQNILLCNAFRIYTIYKMKNKTIGTMHVLRWKNLQINNIKNWKKPIIFWQFKKLLYSCSV